MFKEQESLNNEQTITEMGRQRKQRRPNNREGKGRMEGRQTTLKLGE